jgi:hypothetical protein
MRITKKKMSKEKLNSEWIVISQQMQLLEAKRKELYTEYRKKYGSIDLETYSAPSIYSDLNRVNITLELSKVQK